MKLIIKVPLVVISLLMTNLSFSQNLNLEWVASLGGTESDRVNSMTTDGDDNIYSVGRFNGTVDFDPSDGIYELSTTSESDGFIQKLDDNGNFLWAIHLENASASDLSIDSNGNVLTVGSFSGTVDFNPGDGEYFLTSVNNSDSFILKLDTNGNFLWVVQINSYGAFNVSIDANGNVYTFGHFSDSIDFDPGDGEYILSSNGSRNYFVQKLDANSNFLWAISFGNGNIVNSFIGNGRYRTFNMAVDYNGNVYTTGNFSNTVDFDPGPEEANLTSTSEGGTGWNTFIQKLDTNGNFLWVKQFETTNDVPNITFDTNNNVYSSGRFRETVDFDPGNDVFELTSDFTPDSFIIKLNENGEFSWAARIGGLGYIFLASMTTNLNNDLYVTGEFDTYLIDFDPGDAVYEQMPNNGQEDIFILKLNVNGQFQWVEQIGGTSRDIGRSITIDNEGNLIIAGYFSGTTDFDPSDETSFDLTSAGNNDVFIQKLNENSLGINDNYLISNQLIIYPNPVENVLHVNPIGQSTIKTLSLIDVNGRTLMTKAINSYQAQEMDMSLYQKGIYFLLIDSDSGTETFKFILK